jgi:hypothetical protein
MTRNTIYPIAIFIMLVGAAMILSTAFAQSVPGAVLYFNPVETD